ncbi:MAG TPA: non-canonical purine NTP pyrophosphatase, partial [Allosphingosinicella sp.]
MRKLEPGRLVIASHNEGKVREIRELLGPYGVDPVSAGELDLPEPEEIGVSFMENADLKARAAADLSGLPALADDSGLCVEALGDRPGIFSARWAYVDPHVSPEAGAGEVTGERDFGLAMRRVQDELEALGPEASRNAHFVCAL